MNNVRTNHQDDIVNLRLTASVLARTGTREAELTHLAAADLLELHDAGGISLDNWPSARAWVELLIGHPITENKV